MMRYDVDTMYDAVVSCDGSFDSEFYYAVRTVGVYCRPSCRSRTPLRKNVEFYDAASEAERAGYRPCKRCRPDLLEYEPAFEIAQQAKDIIDGCYGRQGEFSRRAKDIGVSASHLAAVFKRCFGMSPRDYESGVRFERAAILLKRSDRPIADVAFSVGYESLAAFYRFFKKHAGVPPAEYRALSADPDGKRDVPQVGFPESNASEIECPNVPRTKCVQNAENASCKDHSLPLI